MTAKNVGLSVYVYLNLYLNTVTCRQSGTPCNTEKDLKFILCL